MGKLNNFQGLRAVAFMMIFLSHCSIGPFAAGMAVCIFFVLSGFLMVYNYLSRPDLPCGLIQNIRFSYGKIKKLYPLHLIMLLPMLALEIYSKSFNPLELLANVFLVQAWIPVRGFYFGYNGVAWFLSVCAFLYFIFPYLLKSFKNNYSLKKAFAVIGITFALLFLVALLGNFKILNSSLNFTYITYIFPLYRLGDFIIGCNLGYIFLKEKSNKNFLNLTVLQGTLLELISLVLLLILATDLNPLKSDYHIVAALPFVSLFIFILGFNKGFLSKMLSQKSIFVELGNISGYTYLIHQVVINYVLIVFHNKYIVAALSLMLTLFAAYLYRIFINKLPKIQFKRR